MIKGDEFILGNIYLGRACAQTAYTVRKNMNTARSGYTSSYTVPGAHSLIRKKMEG
jgi:hypothetical protein